MPRQPAVPSDPRAVGHTKAVGWEIGVRRTVAHDAARVWDWLLSAEGVRSWLGELAGPLGPGAAFRSADGITGEVRVWRPGAQLRLTRQAPGMARSATVQLRLIPTARGTTVAWHEEHLPDADAREARRRVFEAVVRAVAALSAP